MAAQMRMWEVDGRWYEGDRRIYPSSGEAFWVIYDLADAQREIGTVTVLHRNRYVNDDQPHTRHTTLKSAVKEIVRNSYDHGL
jgi:hypothetical protein